MGKRKTVAVTELVARVNRMIAASADEMQAERQALAVLLESVLMDTGNYKGFQYLSSEFIDRDTATFRENYDATRRKYLG